ncbi:hypothetical protein E1B28_002118 [Marasmius oreades]|uniref:Uncharacterized protein n=1 Tax=Marasmius oreades TaxID=181124 RepID=A0A9P7RMF8_9AGAR|nr:uncharacterized protein E1B28_002118 [Marasmius oreades]KAG7086157.1 hypothetical protein E1B28_002118 [Marasmius oreades]
MRYRSSRKPRRWSFLTWFPRPSRERHLFWWPRRSRQLLGVVFVSIHLSGMGVLGIWHWGVLRIRGLNPSLPPTECFERINTTYLFMDFPITSRRIRILSLAFYSFMVIPVVNIEISVMLVNIISWLIVSPTRRAFRRVIPQALVWVYTVLTVLVYGREWEWLEPRLKCLTAVLFPLIIAVHTVIDTEFMIKKNMPLIGTEESRWTFGQILALMLVILPLLQALSMFTKGTPLGKRLWRWAANINHSPTQNRRFNIDFLWLMRSLLLPSQPWSNLYNELNDEFSKARCAVADLGKEIVDLTDVESSTSHLSLPCVAASAVFALRSLLFLADQTLKITNETFTFPGHPPLIAPIITGPDSLPGSSLTFDEERFYQRRRRRRAKPKYPQARREEDAEKDKEQEQRNAEARIELALKQLKHALTEARDKVSIAQSVRFPDIEGASRYNAVASHLRHLLIVLDTTLITSKNLELTRACYLREETSNPDRYHVCHFNYRDAVGQMSANLVYDLGGMFERDFKEREKNQEGGVDLSDLKELFDDKSQAGSSSNE